MSCPSSHLGRKLLAIAIAVQATACATPGYFAVPSVSVDELYDDNLFYASEDRQSDFITRVSPALEVGYAANTFSLSARYRFDAEAYARETELNSALVRQFADLELEYLPTERLTLSAAVDYTKTDTPLDLSIIPGGTIPGLLVGRTEAERTSVHSAASYRLTSRTSGSVAYSQSNEALVDAGESETDVLETWFDQRLSGVNTLNYGHMYRQYRFDQYGLDGEAGPPVVRGAAQDTNTPWIGLSHEFNAKTQLAARAGPRLDGGSVDPYVLVSLQHRLPNGVLQLDYERDETTLLGEPGILELEALYATISRRFGTRLDVQLTPG